MFIGTQSTIRFPKTFKKLPYLWLYMSLTLSLPTVGTNLALEKGKFLKAPCSDSLELYLKKQRNTILSMDFMKQNSDLWISARQFLS